MLLTKEERIPNEEVEFKVVNVKFEDEDKHSTWVSNPQNPNNIFSFLALQETNRTEARRISSEHSVIWQLPYWGEKAELLFLNPDCLTVVITA